MPRREGGNIFVQLDVEDYMKGVRDIQYNIVWRLQIHKGEIHPVNMSLKSQLESTWGFNKFKLAAMKVDVFHVILSLLEDQSSVMAQGAINLKSSIFWVSR